MQNETDDAETDYPLFVSLTIGSAPHWLIAQLDDYAKSREPGRRRLIERFGRNAFRHLAEYDDDTLCHQLALVEHAETALKARSQPLPAAPARPKTD